MRIKCDNYLPETVFVATMQAPFSPSMHSLKNCLVLLMLCKARREPERTCVSDEAFESLLLPGKRLCFHVGTDLEKKGWMRRKVRARGSCFFPRGDQMRKPFDFLQHSLYFLGCSGKHLERAV